jgi:hypothetical protein
MMTPAEHREAMYGLCIAHISSPAENRMRSRTAKEQLAQAMADANRDQAESVPDADDESAQRDRVLT